MSNKLTTLIRDLLVKLIEILAAFMESKKSVEIVEVYSEL